ncbi:MAG: hypothetical protein ACREV8_00060 [Gammaproteobacteria bacterium]
MIIAALFSQIGVHWKAAAAPAGCTASTVARTCYFVSQTGYIEVAAIGGYWSVWYEPYGSGGCDSDFYTVKTKFCAVGAGRGIHVEFQGTAVADKNGVVTARDISSPPPGRNSCTASGIIILGSGNCDFTSITGWIQAAGVGELIFVYWTWPGSYSGGDCIFSLSFTAKTKKCNVGKGSTVHAAVINGNVTVSDIPAPILPP